MLERLGPVLLALAMATAGCVGSPAGDDGAAAPAAAGADELPEAAPAPGERTLEEPPTLREGEWWTVELSSDVYGVDAEATVVVAGVDGDRYMVGMPSEDFVHEAMILHLPALGPVHRDTLGYESHDRLHEPLKFPLEEGQGWSTEWYTGLLDAEVVDVSNGTARVEHVGENTRINLTHEAGLGLPKRAEIPGYGSYEVTDHGYGYEGEVTVPWNHDVIFLNGRLGPAANLSLAPAPPVEEVEVEGPYDGASIALLLGNALVDGPPGAYRVAADAPTGSSYEAAFVPQPGGEQLHMVPHGTGDPTGTWTMEYEAAGPGVAAVEGLGYATRTVALGSPGG